MILQRAPVAGARCGTVLIGAGITIMGDSGSEQRGTSIYIDSLMRLNSVRRWFFGASASGATYGERYGINWVEELHVGCSLLSRLLTPPQYGTVSDGVNPAAESFVNRIGAVQCVGFADRRLSCVELAAFKQWTRRLFRWQLSNNGFGLRCGLNGGAD